MTVHRILVTDEVDAEGVAILAAVPGFAVDVVPTLPAAELAERIGDYDALVGRSATRVSAELLRRGTRLRVVGRAGVGVDNVDMARATELGVAIINAPAGNTVAVAELLFGALISFLRRIPEAVEGMRAGRWDRSTLMGRELRGRTLGIIGLGRIGSEVARRAKAFGMELLAYDPYIPEERFGAATRCGLEELLARADVVTVHTPLTDETRHLVDPRRLKRGAVLVNMARGGIVDDAALIEALENGLLSGAVLDVYESEPLSPEHPLRRLSNVLLMPHMGASTVEAQRNVAVDVSEAVRDALLSGELSRSLNVAELSREEWADSRPVMLLARRCAALARAMMGKPVRRLAVRGGNDLVLASAAIGVLEGVVDVEEQRLNLINARAVAESRGIELSLRGSGDLEVEVDGFVVGGVGDRLTRIGEYRVDVGPTRHLLVLTNRDVPGVIGRVGTLLGEARVNIATYHQARLGGAGGAGGGTALAAIAVDERLPRELKPRLLALPDVLSATHVTFQ